MKFLTQVLFLKSQRVLPVFRSEGMSVRTGLGRPLATIVIGVPKLVLVEPPTVSGGKKSLPQGLRFRLPYLWAAGVSWIVRESIFRYIAFQKLSYYFLMINEYIKTRGGVKVKSKVKMKNDVGISGEQNIR